MEKTLLLNATYEPLRIISWKKAITLLILEKVEVIEHYDRMIHSISFALPLPAVVRLRHMVKWRKDDVKFSRQNIYARDQGLCQYCGKNLHHREITYDHVIPKSQGGITSWENVVTCCIACNRKKGGRTPQQARMTLLKLPRRPAWHDAFRLAVGGLPYTPESWHAYLYWNVKVDVDTTVRSF
ncbi:HNH endonuclease [candidate division KSB3 bacterium]|jgi:5-methylcytosine-specific restriction endonuclease McrA|uniref:HNH endonuclease n=1 Tax=candidate division KSB3 bacterium TaxID=2044937 RepID=A0A9D5JTB7_9BACT|nr:HNH endonuclease [candidate division KSB3 bacterium]MBD3323868.1 HNH endonuclease [candidate division KSB3 bacterium]